MSPDKILVFDVESDGVDVFSSNILTCYAGVYDRNMNLLSEGSWTIDHGTEVPEGASAVNGLTTEYMREHGRKDVAECLWEIVRFISAGPSVVVAHNLPFDLTILRENFNRHMRSEPLASSWHKGFNWLDTLVISKHLDKYAKGGHKLMTVAERHGIAIEEARLHEARYDVEVCAQVAWKLLERTPFTVEQLQLLQKSWKAEQSASLQQWIRDNKDRNAVINGDWPLQERA